MDNQLTCNNCKFFLCHYVKTDRGFIQTVYGHCANKQLRFRHNRDCKACKFWQEKINQEQQNYNIKKSLNKIANDLKIIAQYFKE